MNTQSYTHTDRILYSLRLRCLDVYTEPRRKKKVPLEFPEFLNVV